MKMLARGLALLALLLALPWVRPFRAVRAAQEVPTATTAYEGLIFPNPDPEELERRVHCGRQTLLGIRARALATPVVGAELLIEVTAQNGGLPGPFEIRLNASAEQLEPLDRELIWKRALPEGKAVTWITRVKVLSHEPIAVTAKVRSLAPGRRYAVPVEYYLKLFPFEVKDGKLRAAWDQQEAPPGAPSKRPTLRLPGGSLSTVYRLQ